MGFPGQEYWGGFLVMWPCLIALESGEYSFTVYPGENKKRLWWALPAVYQISSLFFLEKNMLGEYAWRTSKTSSARDNQEFHCEPAHSSKSKISGHCEALSVSFILLGMRHLIFSAAETLISNSAWNTQISSLKRLRISPGVGRSWARTLGPRCATNISKSFIHCRAHDLSSRSVLARITQSEMKVKKGCWVTFLRSHGLINPSRMLAILSDVFLLVSIKRHPSPSSGFLWDSYSPCWED